MDWLEESWNERLKDARLKDQKQQKDYNDEMEKCECGCYLNAHDHCPRCDYQFFWLFGVVSS